MMLQFGDQLNYCGASVLNYHLCINVGLVTPWQAPPWFDRQHLV